MNLHIRILDKLIDLPGVDQKGLRRLLDELGLCVKGIEGEGKDAVFNVETSPNRGDHLSALGVARELGAKLLSQLKSPAMASDLPDRKASVAVRRETDLCPRYALLEMTLGAGFALPPVVAEVFGKDGKHHPVVDCLNYILREIGQPMHAFDKEKIDGEIVISTLSKPEEIEALDGKSYVVPEGAVVIRDRKKIVAVAGVIGCSNSMVTTATTKVLVESALFDPVSVRMTARRIGLSTDASYTFQRGTDIEMVVPALRRLTFLTGAAGGVVKDTASAHVIGLTVSDRGSTEKRQVTVRLPVVKKQMNLPRLPDVEILTRLKYLGYGVVQSEKDLIVTVPSWRLWDVRDEEDVVEDVVRSHGMMSIKLELPELESDPPERDISDRLRDALEPALLGSGFNEVISRSYYGREQALLVERLWPELEGRHVTLKNALDSAYSHMRASLAIPLAALAANAERMGVRSFKVFERGNEFLLPRDGVEQKGVYPFEREVLALATLGRWCDNEWRKPESIEGAVSLMRGAVGLVLDRFGLDLVVGASSHPLLHPGIQGSIKSGRLILGVFGALHPEISSSFGLRGQMLFAEIDTAMLGRLWTDREVKIPIDFPSVRRDLTLAVPKREMASRIEKNIWEAKPANLSDVATVDDYTKDGEQFRRLSLRLTFQNEMGTLTSGDVDQSMTKILEHLKNECEVALAPS